MSTILCSPYGTSKKLERGLRGHPQFISLYLQGMNIDFLLRFSFYPYTNSERKKWAEHSLIPSFVIRSISFSSDTCVACTEGKRVLRIDVRPVDPLATH